MKISINKKLCIPWKNFEIRPVTDFMSDDVAEDALDIVKWVSCKPLKTTDLKTGEVKYADKYCYSIGRLVWDCDEDCFVLESVGKRFLEHYEEGLSDFILKAINVVECECEKDE